MSQPIIKYTLTKQGRQPEWLSSDARAFKGEHGTPANKPGKLPRYGSPQDTIYLGIGAGEPDSDGTPDGYVGKIATKAALKTYITGIGTAAGYKVITPTVTGVTTSVITGPQEAWNATEDYSGPGLTTTTSDKVTSTGTGTIQTFDATQVTKVVVETTNNSGVTTSVTDTPITVDPASTVSDVTTSDSVGIVTTTRPESGTETVKTTTTTSAFTYTDVNTNKTTSTSSTTTDGDTTRTDTVTTTETTNYVTAYDYDAEATRLWNIHQAINS